MGKYSATPYVGMSLAQKEVVVFGVNKVYYKTKAQADKNMIKIKVHVWKYNQKNDRLYSSTATLNINKRLQSDISSIFDAIYHSDEKFPIKSVGAYSWRGKAGNSANRSHHSYGTAIDINWEENYMIKGDKIIAGTLYDPGNNKYSIPSDGIIVTTFKNHGWIWGGDWKSSKDYMHFSFLGK